MSARTYPAPRDCEECPCETWRWNGAPSMYRDDPPSTCTCGHLTSRHRFHPTDGRGNFVTNQQI